MSKRTMTVQKATQLAQTLDLANFDGMTFTADQLSTLISSLAQAIADAIAAGVEVVDLVLDDDAGTITLEPNDGVMVSWMLPDYLADQLEVDGGETDLHVTLAYLGHLGELDLEQQRMLVGVVSEAIENQPQLYGLIADTSTFPASDSSEGRVPWFAEVNIPELDVLRANIVEQLTAAGLPVHDDFDGWHPHVTLAYLEDGTEPPAVELDPQVVTITDITVSLGGSRRTLDLQPRDDWAEREAWLEEQLGSDYWQDFGRTYRPFVKSVLEAPKRFTLGPWYIPDTLDAHGEWTDADELQEALWGYVDSGDRSVYLQHTPDIEAGRWVEIMQLPWPMEIPVQDMNGEVIGHVYPAGTVLMGVIWEPWSWELVLSGSITGFSIGGNALRLEAEPPDLEDLADGGADEGEENAL